MEGFDNILRRQVDSDKPKLHNVSFCAIGKEGTLYSAAYGSRDLARTQPVTVDSVYWLASLSKLSTAVAGLIAVDQGLVSLDANVRDIVPELADLEVLEGFDDDDEGKPRLRKCTAPITLRQLLSHSSGFCYDKMDEGLQRWAAYVGKKEGTFTGSYEGYRYPLIFEPGNGWAYGPGMDWAGRVVEIVAKQDLESFMQTNIWTPLQMHSTTFRPWTRPDLEAKLVQAAIRTPAVTAGGSGNLIKGKVPFGYPAPDCCGGAGLYSTPADQAKLLSALLEGGNNNKILSAASLDELLRPQLTAIGTMSHSHFLTEVNGPPKTHVGNIMWPQGSKGAGFGLGASINAERFSGRRAAGSANWQGMPGINAFLDRTSGLAGVFFTQVLPPGDQAVVDCFVALEEELYRLYGSESEENGVFHV